MAAEKKIPDNQRAEPMTYTVTVTPSLQAQRNVLALEAESMSMEDLKTAAANAQIPITGRSKADAVADIQAAVTPTEA